MHPEKASPFQGRDNLGVVENQQKQKHTLCKCPLCLHLLLLCADFVFFLELVLEPGCCFSHHRNIFSEVFSLFFFKVVFSQVGSLSVETGRRAVAPLCSLCACVLCKLSEESSLQPMECVWPGFAINAAKYGVTDLLKT